MYTTDKVVEIINSYHRNIKLLKEFRKDYASVGVAQGGIESVMPRGKGTTSDVVANEAIRQLENNDYFAEVRTDIKYLQDRLYRVTDEEDAIILSNRLDGAEVVTIACMMECSERKIYDRLRKIAKIISMN